MLVTASGLGSVGWDEIGGLDEAKELLKEAVLLPMLIPSYFTGAAPACGGSDRRNCTAPGGRFFFWRAFSLASPSVGVCSIGGCAGGWSADGRDG